MSLNSAARDSDGSLPHSYERRAARTRSVARTAGMLAVVALAAAVLTVIAFAVQGHRTPGVVGSGAWTVAIGLVVASVIAEGISTTGYLLRRRAVVGRTLATCALAVAVCAVLLILLMWV